jgi:hypothetical protein
LSSRVGAVALRKFCEKVKGTYPSPRAGKFVAKIDLWINRQRRVPMAYFMFE